jgi:ABC-2 type transport system permease protein
MSAGTTPGTPEPQGSQRPRQETPWWRLVAQREVTTRVREKSFLIGIGLTVLFLIAFFVAAAVFGGPEDYDVAVVGPEEAALVEQAQGVLRGADSAEGSADGSEQATIDAVEVADTPAAEQAVTEGEVDAALLATGEGYELVGDDGVDTSLAAAVAQVVSASALQQNATEQGVDLTALDAGTQVDQRLLDPGAGDSDARSTVAFAFTLIFLMTAFAYGMAIAQSVVVEKETRVVELLAAAIPIRSLLWGKILGNTALALGQLLLVVVVGVGGLVVTGRTELLSGIGPAVGWYLAFFVLGFLALAALWSVAGSLAGRQEDLQSTTLPMQMLLFIPYFVSAFASDAVNEVVSMVPVASSMVMPARMAQESVPGWQIAVAIVLTVLAAVVFVRIGSRIYERTLLRSDGKIGLREALSTAR